MRILEKLNDLGFVIGAFFTIVAVVLFANIFIMALSDGLSIYTASTFLVFGLTMMIASKKKN